MTMEVDKELWDRLSSNTARIINSGSNKKLIVAGPGTGKTTSFKNIIKSLKTDKNKCLVLTFINNLKSDLEEVLSDLAKVYTFHGYCHYLLRKNRRYRENISKIFQYFPKLIKVIKSDWEIFNQSDAPQFKKLMQTLEIGKETKFFIERSDYYDAVGYDDSVFRVFQGLSTDIGNQTSYHLIIVDEYQDFNLLEVTLLNLMSVKSPILISGDDDQALYAQLRNSDPKYIRDLYVDEGYENFELPYCTRCTEVIVDAFNDIIEEALAYGKLSERVDKPFMYFPPIKKSDSEKYPKINIINTSVQLKSLKTNYFGRYISNEISKIEGKDVIESRKEGFPTVLIIGSNQYLRQVHDYLISENQDCSYTKRDDVMDLELTDGLELLKQNEESNLGWRVVLEICKPEFTNELIDATNDQGINLYEIVPKEFKDDILGILEKSDDAEQIEQLSKTEAEDITKPKIVLTSFEGAKGLSAQHVFIIGMQAGDLPRDNENPTDFEINKFLVALTRTRMQCHILHTRRFGALEKRPSIFLNWISNKRLEKVWVDKKYWS